MLTKKGQNSSGEAQAIEDLKFIPSLLQLNSVSLIPLRVPVAGGLRVYTG